MVTTVDAPGWADDRLAPIRAATTGSDDGPALPWLLTVTCRAGSNWWRDVCFRPLVLHLRPGVGWSDLGYDVRAPPPEGDGAVRNPLDLTVADAPPGSPVGLWGGGVGWGGDRGLRGEGVGIRVAGEVHDAVGDHHAKPLGGGVDDTVR